MKTDTLLVPVGTLVPGARILLEREEVHHLRVRRATREHVVRACDGAGVVGEGMLVEHSGEWSLDVTVADTVTRSPETTLCVGAGDRDRMLWLAEKCTELGVTRLVPFSCERTRDVESRLRENTIAKAQRRARESCKQSGNPWATEIAALTPLEALLASRSEARVFLAAAGGAVLPRIVANEPVSWFIGPEGGLTDAEEGAIVSRLDAAKVSLGDHILRFETAGVAAGVLTALARMPGAVL